MDEEKQIELAQIQALKVERGKMKRLIYILTIIIILVGGCGIDWYPTVYPRRVKSLDELVEGWIAEDKLEMRLIDFKEEIMQEIEQEKNFNEFLEGIREMKPCDK